jgi:hypothetical protein
MHRRPWLYGERGAQSSPTIERSKMTPYSPILTTAHRLAVRDLTVIGRVLAVHESCCWIRAPREPVADEDFVRGL